MALLFLPPGRYASFSRASRSHRGRSCRLRHGGHPARGLAVFCLVRGAALAYLFGARDSALPGGERRGSLGKKNPSALTGGANVEVHDAEPTSALQSAEKPVSG